MKEPQENIIHTQVYKCVQVSVHSTTVCSRQETGTTADAQTVMCPYCGTPFCPHEASTAIILMTLGNSLLSDESQLQKNKQTKNPHTFSFCVKEIFLTGTPRDNLSDQWPGERELGWRVSQWYRFHIGVVRMS